MRPELRKSQQLALAATIAALYAVVTIYAPIPQYQEIQLRIADTLSVLPFFLGWPGIIGLSLGCLVANIFSPYGVLDMVIGTASTLVGTTIVAYIGSRTRKQTFKRNLLIALLITSVETGLFIGWLLNIYGVPFLFGFFSVTIGELITIVLIGYPVGLKLPELLPGVFGVND